MEEGPTFATLYLDSWETSDNKHCPVLYFTVEYRLAQSKSEWIKSGSNIDPEQKKYVLSGLQPATWYSLRMTAHNGAGTSTAEYDFATLTKTGGKLWQNYLDDYT